MAGFGETGDGVFSFWTFSAAISLIQSSYLDSKVYHITDNYITYISSHAPNNTNIRQEEKLSQQQQ